MSDRERVLSAMASGEWLRTQWIARAAFDLGTRPWLPEDADRILGVLRPLEDSGLIEKRCGEEFRDGEIDGVYVGFPIPRPEWHLVDQPEETA